jgi:hypothetical protein
MTTNPRGRIRTDTLQSASKPRQSSGIQTLQTSDPTLNAWAAAVKQRLEVGSGARGTPFDKWLTKRDMEDRLKELGVVTQPAGVPLGGGIAIAGPGGGLAYTSFDDFANSIMNTRLFGELTAAIDDPHRFDDLPEQVRKELLVDIATEAQQRGADIRRLDQTIQSATESFAQTVEEITAAVAGAAAGVRQVRFAYASSNRATAGIVTQVQARLDNFSGGAPGTATVESKMTAIADRATGLEAQYVLKVATSGGAIAGFGLAATTSIAGVSTSSMLFLANKFAFVTNTDVIGTGAGQINPLSPPANRIMFGIDADGAYVGGNLNVAGKAVIQGKYTVASIEAALHVNQTGAAATGLNTNTTTAGGNAIYATATNGANAVRAVVTGNLSFAGSFSGLGAGTTGVYAEGELGGIALDVAGPIRISTGNFATGSATASVPLNNKPGSNVATANEWVEFYKAGVRGWIPWVPHS